MSAITKEDLEIAFGKTLADKGFSEEQILKMADDIITLFGFDNAVIDNRLEPKQRDLFYKLEEAGLMHTQQEEVTLAKGKVWRLHYWFLNRELILKLSRGLEDKVEADEFAVYSEMDEEVWTKHGENKEDE
ncbi:MAG: DUF6015 family protein [Thermoplasmata archaeon]